MKRETLDALEVRFVATDDAGAIEAVAVRFGVVDSYRTTFDRAAFDVAAPVPMLWSHRADEVIGSWSSFRIEGDGLRATGSLNLDVQRAREVRSMLQRGDIRGVSIGFATLKDERRAGNVRHITSALLREVSLVAFPSIPGTHVTKFRSQNRESAAVEILSAVRGATRALQKGLK